MDTDGWQKIFLIIEIILIFLKAFFTACEYSVLESSESKIRSDGEDKPQNRRVLKLMENERKLIKAFTVGRVGAYMLMGFPTLIIVEKIDLLFGVRKSIRDIGMLSVFVWIMAVSVVIGVIIAALTEFVPRRIIRKDPEKAAVKTSLITTAYVAVMGAPGSAAYGISKLISRIFGVSFTQKHDVVTEEDIRQMVDEGNETGVIEENQRDMINNIFDFGDVDVSDVMTHRKDIVAVEVNEKIADIVYIAINKGYSRIPVYEKTVDSIIGIIYVKDLLCLVGCEQSEDFTIKQFMRKVLYLPETCMCSDAFEALTKEKQQCAVVVDEYGGTAGFVSMEDILEEIVGSIQDEYDDENAEIVKLEDGVYTISGDVRPEDAEEALGFRMPDEHNYDTMSAFVVDLLGRIPEEDEAPTVSYGGYNFTVLLAEDNWISKIKAEKTEQPQKENEE